MVMPAAVAIMPGTIIMMIIPVIVTTMMLMVTDTIGIGRIKQLFPQQFANGFIGRTFVAGIDKDPGGLQCRRSPLPQMPADKHRDTGFKKICAQRTMGNAVGADYLAMGDLAIDGIVNFKGLGLSEMLKDPAILIGYGNTDRFFLIEFHIKMPSLFFYFSTKLCRKKEEVLSKILRIPRYCFIAKLFIFTPGIRRGGFLIFSCDAAGFGAGFQASSRLG